MKLQDLFFLMILALLLVWHRRQYFVWAGLVSLLFAIPLFAQWIFFTAERLTWYAAAFFLIFLLFSLFAPDKVQ
ncbi:MAG: hypothetical protein ACOY0S_03020 [Patescibacteria group bacterium]